MSVMASASRLRTIASSRLRSSLALSSASFRSSCDIGGLADGGGGALPPGGAYGGRGGGAFGVLDTAVAMAVFAKASIRETNGAASDTERDLLVALLKSVLRLLLASANTSAPSRRTSFSRSRVTFDCAALPSAPLPLLLLPLTLPRRLETRSRLPLMAPRAYLVAVVERMVVVKAAGCG